MKLDQIIQEASLSRVASHTKKPFAILTAFRGGLSLRQNRQRNRSLESALRQSRMGGIKLVGHWREAPDGMDWRDATPEQLEDITEESFFIPKPQSMEFEEFKYIIQSLTFSFNQDAAVISDGSAIMLISKHGQLDKIGSGPSFQKLGQAYSQLRRKPNNPFIFEGVSLGKRLL